MHFFAFWVSSRKMYSGLVIDFFVSGIKHFLFLGGIFGLDFILKVSFGTYILYARKKMSRSSMLCYFQIYGKIN